MEQSFRNKIFGILEISSTRNWANKCVNIFLMSLISLNIFAVMLETVETLADKYEKFFYFFEVFSVSVFTIEYLLRLWSCTTNPKYENALTGRIRFAVTPLAIVDLMAIVPFYLPLLIPVDLRFIRGLRLFRLFRLFKMTRYSESLRTFWSVLREKKEELVITLCVVFTLLLFASTLMFYVEREAQPKIFSSIPAAMWWGVVTLTTVGYGDIYPVTHFGKFLGAIIAILGIGTFAMPAGILASGFSDVIRKKREKKYCPHCGNNIDSLLTKSKVDSKDVMESEKEG